MVLTAVAYKLTVAACVPQVSYLTQLDLFVLLCFLFMFLCCIENAVVSQLARRADVARRLDTGLMFAWVGGWGLTCAWYLHSSRRIGARRRAARAAHEGVAVTAGLEIGQLARVGPARTYPHQDLSGRARGYLAD